MKSKYKIIDQTNVKLNKVMGERINDIEQEQVVLPDSRNTTISRVNEILKHQIMK